MPVPDFYEDTHTYLYEFEQIPSVTQILSATGHGADYDGIPSNVLKKAADIGTETHKVIEEFHKYNIPIASDNERVAEYLIGYKNFLKYTDFELFVSESRLCDPEYWYAGTCDLVGWLNSEACVIDVKTTSKIHTKTVSLQLGGYQNLVEVEYDIEINKKYALQLTRSGLGFKLEDFSDLGAHKSKFLQLAREYNGS